jgi:hypothetical protein
MPASGDDAVSAAILDRYVGEYSSPPNVPIATFRRVDTTLFVKGSNPEGPLHARELPLTALSETRFRDPLGQIYEFQLDARGRVTGALLELRGPDGPQSIRLLRIWKVE